jgi:hypothetical protein
MRKSIVMALPGIHMDEATVAYTRDLIARSRALLLQSVPSTFLGTPRERVRQIGGKRDDRTKREFRKDGNNAPAPLD